jgi:eukaryotic-like serine/threonine-protein kinase
MALTSGTKLGPYEILAPLGAGGMGEVYRARDTRLDRTVAIKVLASHLSSSPELKQRFEREAKSISALNHPHICSLYDVGSQDGIDYLVMEFLEGETLAERLRQGVLPLKETLKVGMEVSEALEVAHRAGITHRDLKPGNIMLTKSGAKLMDFGLAKATAAGLAAGASNAPLLSAARTTSGPSPMSPLTSVGEVIGTIEYMSPEQIEGKKADARSDLFALGAVLYEMATGKRTFAGKSQISVASAILEKDPEPISATQPLTPPAFEHVVSTCLAKNPEDRFQTAHDVRLQLKWTAEGASRLMAQGMAPPAPKILSWTIATLAIIALVVGGAFFVTKHDKPEVRYTVVTHREGSLQAARFSRDGQTIIYGGEWEGEPPQVAIARVGSPESRLLGIPPGTIAAVSSSDELAVLWGCEYVFLVDCGGTLATVSLAGGSPRDLARHVAYADWSPDGKQLAVSVYSREGARLEFPPGHVLYQQKTGWFGHPRFSPDGRMIAYENHPTVDTDEGSIEGVDLSGKRTVLSKGSLSLEGLAWSPDGKEVWFAGASHSGWADSIHAVTLAGKERIVSLLPSVRLHDIARDGRVLLSRESWRTQLMGLFPGDSHEHPYSWLDGTSANAISADGRVISFYEGGEVYYIEGDLLGYYRRTDGSAAVRLGTGTAAISPDGKWVLAFSRKGRKLVVQPIGPGEPKELPTPELVDFGHLVWSDDGQEIAYEAQTSQNDWNVYTQRVGSGSPILAKASGRNAFPILSPDGGMLAVREERGGISLYRMDGSQPVAVKGVLDNEYPIRFAKGGRSLLVAEPTGHQLVLTLVELASGRRELWKRLTTEARGTTRALIVVTPDLRYYAYQSPRYSSDLYILDNLR